MATTILKTPTCSKVGCPSELDLADLLDAETPVDAHASITEHIGECEGCQKRLDLMATGENAILAEAIRAPVVAEPPAKHSALWQALDDVTGSATLAHESTVKNYRSGELELDFLEKTDKPGLIGRLGTFDIVRVVGRGGMGVVLHAFDPSLQRDVAIKLLDPQLASNTTARQRFCREARAAGAVTHENIVAVHQVDEDPKSGLPFFVMQLVSGESLDQRLRRVGKLPINDAIRLAAQAAAGLSAAHASGLIHRDIKPGNMLLEEPADRLKLTDFGLARSAEDLRLTRTGFVSGTPLYMAPEQAKGDDSDQRADLFSLGIVLYECLAGKPPFDGKTPLAVLRRVADEPHEPLNHFSPDVPKWFEDVIDRLLAKDPNDRYATAAQLAAELAPFVPNHSSLPCDAVAAEPCGLSPPSQLSRRALRKWKLKFALLMTIPFLLGVFVTTAFWIAVLPLSTVEPAPKDAPADDGLSSAHAPFAGNSGPVWSVGVTSDGKTLVMGLEDGRIIVYDIPGRRLQYTLEGHRGPVWGIDFFPDDKRFVSVSDDGSVKIWELGKREPLKILPGTSGVRSVAVAAHGKSIATGDRSGIVKVWDIADQKSFREFVHGGTVTSIAFDKQGMMVASAGSDKTVKLWNLSSEDTKPRLELSGHQGPIYAVALSPDDSLIASAGWDGAIKIWDENNGTQLRELKGHTYDVWSLSFGMRDGKLALASAGQDGSVRVWDPNAGEQTLKFQGHKPTAHVVRFGPDSSDIFSGGRDGFVRVWDVPK